MSLLVLCPTRGRPAAAAATYESFLRTRALVSETQILFVINDDEDPAMYGGLPILVVSRREWMNEVLAQAVDLILRFDLPDLLGFVGDDNRFVTMGWDAKVGDMLRDGGFAYLNDHLRPDLPTHVFVSSSIVRSLGYLGLPGLRHLYIDNTWKVLGTGAGCLYYMPYVVMEHLNPLAGKGEQDDSFRKSNSRETYEHDRDVFTAWLASGAERDVELVREALRG